MKTFSIGVCLTLMATSLALTWFAVSYRQMARNVRAQALAVNSQAQELKKRTTEYNALPTPFAEILREALQERGYTNLNCLVWGEKNGKTLGFMVGSNEVTALPGMEVHMRQVDAADTTTKRRL
jgi:hypothetical protein